MEWTISFLSDQKIVVIETRGIADEAGSFEMSKSIAKTMVKHMSMRCLIDHSAIISFSGSISEIYFRPKGLLKFGIPFKVRIAEVVLPEYKKNFDFLETVFRNRGFDFRVFNDRDSALRWLAT